MTHDLKSEILNTCRGYERDHIMKVINEIASENSSRQMKELYNMKPCPICGKQEGIVTNVMRRSTDGRMVVAGRMGYCKNCKYHSRKIMDHELPLTHTDASWTLMAVKAWNDYCNVNMFSVCEELFGEEYQYAMNSEEVFELIESLTRYGKLTARDRRYDRRQDDSSIISEMADVIICIYQLLHTRRVSPEVLNNVMRDKIERTCNNESVRSAIAGLSKRIIGATAIQTEL